MKLWFRGGALAVITAVAGMADFSCTPAASDPTPDGVDEDAGVGGGGEGDSGTSPDLAPDAAPSLGCPAGCLPPAPDGWTGPSAVYDGAPASKPGACPSQYAVSELEAHQGLMPTPAVCSCGAAKFETSTCNTVVELWTEALCSGFASTREGAFPFSKCIGAGVAYETMRVLPAVYAGTCSFETPAKTIPPPVFEKVQVACGREAPAACAGRPECTSAPAPDAPFSRVCIRREGEHACPSADYAVRLVSHHGVSDSRDCTPCGKGVAKGTCGTAPTAWNASDCTGTAMPITVNTCYSEMYWVDLNGAGPMNATCEPEPGGNEPTGELASADPVTFCCNQ